MGVVKTKSNQDEKHLKASRKDAFCLRSPLCPCCSCERSSGSLRGSTARMRRATLPLAMPTQQVRERSLAMLRLGWSGGPTPTLGEEPSTMLLTTLASGQPFESWDLDCYH